MRTSNYKLMLEEIFRSRGIDPDGATTLQKATVADMITNRCKEGWEYDFWPEWTFLEERAYRNLYSVSTTYAAAAEVWDGGTKYYSSVAADNLNHALTLTAYWTDITATMDNYILLNQVGETRIGAVKDIYVSESDGQKEIKPLGYVIDSDRITMTDSRAGATVWVKYRKIAPQFTNENWAAATTYIEGWIVYWLAAGTSVTQLGLCYRASTTLAGVQYWEEMEVPEILRTWIVMAVTADYFKNDNQLERANELLANAYDELARVHSSNMKQQGLYKIARIVVP